MYNPVTLWHHSALGKVQPKLSMGHVVDKVMPVGWLVGAGAGADDGEGALS